MSQIMGKYLSTLVVISLLESFKYEEIIVNQKNFVNIKKLIPKTFFKIIYINYYMIQNIF
jgi:hypothetical protein